MVSPTTSARSEDDERIIHDTVRAIFTTAIASRAS